MFSDDELDLIRGCLLSTREIFNVSPIKTKKVKNKKQQIELLYYKILDIQNKKIEEGS